MLVKHAADSVYYGSAGEALLFSQLSKVESNHTAHWRSLAAESLDGVLLNDLSKFGANSGWSASSALHTVLPAPSHANFPPTQCVLCHMMYKLDRRCKYGK